MKPNDDPELRGLLKEWTTPEAPASLEQRVLGRGLDWSFLWRGSIRIPVPVACALAVLLVAGTWQGIRLAEKSASCIAAAPSAVATCPSDLKC